MDYYCCHLHLCTSLHSRTVLFCIYGLFYCYLVHCLHCTIIQLFGYLYSRKSANKLIVIVIVDLIATSAASCVLIKTNESSRNTNYVR